MRYTLTEEEQAAYDNGDDPNTWDQVLDELNDLWQDDATRLQESVMILDREGFLVVQIMPALVLVH